jgi:hypothetical protein
MQTMQQPRYGRPRGTGLDDSHQLESLAALLAANPGLKPTTAIRHLGVDDPSAIRRLRDKFRVDQARLMANARNSFRGNGDNVVLLSRPVPQRVVPATPSNPPAAPEQAAEPRITVEPVQNVPQQPPFAVWCEFGLWAMTTAIDQQAAITRHLLRHPAVENALRAQIAVGAFLVAASTPRKPLKPRVH